MRLVHAPHVFGPAASLEIVAVVLFAPLTADSFQWSIVWLSPIISALTVGVPLNRDYILDATSHLCYPFLVLESLSTLVKWFRNSLWPLRVNKCCIASSVVMCFGCFFFFLG
jgi:hypothetical protein